MLEVPDARRDVRFARNPLVVSDPRIRFYAGIPLRDGRGFGLGALCVMDYEARHLSPSQPQRSDADFLLLS